MNNMRSKSSENRYSGADAQDYSFNQYAGGFKTIPMSGFLKPLGAANTVVRIDPGSIIALYNDSATTAFAKIGDNSSLTPPTGGADGVCLRPNDYTVLSVAEFNGIISNSANVFAYLLVDDLLYNKKSGIV
jgi:hypothetical protein